MTKPIERERETDTNMNKKDRERERSISMEREGQPREFYLGSTRRVGKSGKAANNNCHKRGHAREREQRS